jgi:hypothetical protein
VDTFRQDELDALISCPKEISEAPKREMRLSGAHWRNDATLVASNDLKGEFTMFMRRNEEFPENFSIGLTYLSQDGRDGITLLRCNGPHGCYNSDFALAHPHFDYHIHQASGDAIEAGYAAEKSAVKTMEYASFEEALQFFVKAVNLNAKDAQKYFPAGTQIPFSFNE